MARLPAHSLPVSLGLCWLLLLLSRPVVSNSVRPHGLHPSGDSPGRGDRGAKAAILAFTGSCGMKRAEQLYRRNQFRE